VGSAKGENTPTTVNTGENLKEDGRARRKTKKNRHFRESENPARTFRREAPQTKPLF
jgi:hypothetical protein